MPGHRNVYSSSNNNIKANPPRPAKDDSPDESCSVCDTRTDSGKAKQLFTDVTDVLERPVTAMALFVLGVIFIVIASKQVKKCFELMEMFGITAKPRDSVLTNFMVAFVIFFVWLDVVLFTKFKQWTLEYSVMAWRYAMRIRESMKNVETTERRAIINKRRR